MKQCVVCDPVHYFVNKGGGNIELFFLVKFRVKPHVRPYNFVDYLPMLTPDYHPVHWRGHAHSDNPPTARDRNAV